MNKVAKFELVSFEQFKKAWMDKNTTSRTDWTNEELLDIYNEIKLPTRGTKGSAGYDFFTPINISVRYGESVVIPTGIRCRIEDGWFLNINPRSGSGFKYGIRLANTHGIIDSDYYNDKNEGHIMVKIVNNDNAVNANKKL